jgi:predicted permease
MEAPYWIHFGIDWRVLAFGVVVTLVTGILCSLPPAWQSWRSDPNATLKSGGSIAGGVAGTRFRATLVAGQLALSLLLLAGAGLLIKTVVRTSTFIVDYDASRVLTADVELADRRYEQEAQIRAFVTNVLERLGRIPGTQAAVLRPVFYAGFGGRPRTMEVEGSRYVPAGASPAFYYAVTPHYFAVFGAPVREGRAFSDADGNYVAIVNQELARRVWPGTSALGQRIRFGDASSRAPWLTVVGVVSDGAGTVFSTRQTPAAYVPFAGFPGRSISIQMSAMTDPGSLVPELRAAVAAVDPDQPIEDVMTMEQAMARWRQPARFVALLMGSLAAVALLMASMGTFGVIAYSVSQRRREIGVRLALGASPRQVEALVARTGLRMTAAGLALGLPAAWVSTRALQGVLAGTSPTDPEVFAAVTATLSIVALAASWLPARRAGKVDPMVVLRSE